MIFRYLGSNENVTAYGYDFSGGNTPDVVEPIAVEKLKGNRHFEVVGEEKEAPKKPGRPKKVKEEA